MRALSLLLATLAWLCSGWALLVGLMWGLGLKCDDACSPYRGWQGDPDAWQWYGVAALGVFVFACGATLFLFVLLRRPVLAGCALVAGAAAAIRLTGALSSEWIDHLDRRSPGELLLILTAVFAPILAVLLTVPATPRPAPSRADRE